MHWNNVPKFDYTLKKFDGYWNIADIDAFVDSELGNDSTGDGSATNPYKTISKVKSIGATKWAAGKKIMVNGVFDEVLSINVGVRIIGAGGGVNGRAAFMGSITGLSTTNYAILDNIIIFHNNNYFTPIDTDNKTWYFSNCYFRACYIASGSTNGIYVYSYYCIFDTVQLYRDYWGSGKHTNYGNNNTFFNCVVPEINAGTVGLILNGNNNHVNNSVLLTDNGFKNKKNVSGAYLDVTNYNFNFLNTSPLYRKGTFNGEAGNYNHVGAGTLGINLIATSASLSASAGYATYDNLEVYSTTKIKRTSTAVTGSLESGYIDLGGIQSNVILGNGSTYEYESGKMLRTIQQTEAHTYRNAFDFYLKYGNDTGSVDTCDWLLMEWGKEIAVTESESILYGNADTNFNSASCSSPSFQYCKFKCIFRTRTP